MGSSDGLSSCEVQFEACSLYLRSQRVHGWTLLTERFDDDGYSGATLDRPALNRLLTLVRRGPIDRILIHRLDRLSRGVGDCVALLDELRRLEVALVIVTAPELGDFAQDVFMLNIMASFADNAECGIMQSQVVEREYSLHSGAAVTPHNITRSQLHSGG